MASITNTYARAFADVVTQSRLDSANVLREVQRLTHLVAASRELRDVWEAPSIPVEQKRALLDAIVAREGISRPVRNFIAVLIDNRRIQFLEAIVKQFEQELNQRLGFIEAEIASARELTEAERRSLESMVEKVTEKKVRARYAKDPELLGGAVVKVGSTIYDGSVKGQLDRIRERLVESS
jgi:F-type H+-transporting ATPase subunit delta